MGAVVGDKRTLMIDAGNSKAHAQYFLSELEKHHVPAPSLVILTHWHWDHIFGLPALDMLSIASSLTKAEMEKLIPFHWTDEALDERVKAGVEIEFCASAIKKEFAGDRNIEIKLPDITFENKLEIDLGSLTCQVEHVGGDHASDSVVVYIKEEKILFLGDAIYANLYAEKWNFTPERVNKLLDSIERFDADTYILSHWKALTRAEYLEEAKILRKAAKLTDQLNGNKPKIKKAFKEYIKRELNENELETINYFVNGYELEKELEHD